MNDEIVSYLRELETGAGSLDIATEFLKFKNADEKMAEVAVQAILSMDRRCSKNEAGRWVAVREKQTNSADKLNEQPFLAISVVCAERKIIYLSAWDVVPQPEPVVTQWFVSADEYFRETHADYSDPLDKTWNGGSVEDFISEHAKLFEKRLLLFISAREKALFTFHAQSAGVLLPDESFLLSRLIQIAGMKLPQNRTIDQFYNTIFSTAPLNRSFARTGYHFSEITQDILQRFSLQGIETMDELYKREAAQSFTFDFTGKEFNLDYLKQQSTGPGVYGFKNKEGEFIYIGKAKNLRRRLCTYFRDSDESPKKLEQLRNQAHALSIFPCGSDLESLIYEHRLIRKYAPQLNAARAINERKGSFEPLADGIVLLPHFDPQKALSVWVRKEQKITLKALGKEGNESLDSADLKEFFFSESTPSAMTDFAELEIVTRWVKAHREDIVWVSISDYASTEELAQAVNAYRSEIN